MTLKEAGVLIKQRAKAEGRKHSWLAGRIYISSRTLEKRLAGTLAWKRPELEELSRYIELSPAEIDEIMAARPQED